MDKLSASHGPEIKNPTPSEIVHALMDIEDDNGSFVIFDSDHGFIQTATSDKGGLLVEYRLNESEEINRCEDMQLSVEQVAEMFERFRRRDLEWVSKHEWAKEKLGKSSSPQGCLGIIILLVILGAGLVI